MINNFIDKSEYKPSHLVYTHETHNTHIYLGDIQSALDLESIQANEISTVVTAATGLDHVSFPSSINHIIYPLLDMKSQNISKFFTEFHHMVEGQLAKGNVLVHCAAGISRSSTLVIAYLMKKHNWSFREAIAFIRKSRPSVLPNLGFQRQLKEYEIQLKQQLSNESRQKQNSRRHERRTGSKTSEERKHNSLPNKNHMLPDIGFMGRTQLRPKILDLFTQQDSENQVQKNSKRNIQENQRQQYEFYGTKRATFKPLKSKSLVDKSPLILNTSPTADTPNTRLKQSMPVSRVEEVLVRRLHLNDKKVATQRQLRIKPLHKLAFY